MTLIKINNIDEFIDGLIALCHWHSGGPCVNNIIGEKILLRRRTSILLGVNIIYHQLVCTRRGKDLSNPILRPPLPFRFSA